MYKRIGIKKLGRTTAHRKALIFNLLRSLVESGSVKTTTAKAKALKGQMESLIVKVKSSGNVDLSTRRSLQDILGNTALVQKFVEIAKKESTTITIKKVGFRAGDNSEVSLVEIKGLAKKEGKKEVKEKKEEKVVVKKESTKRKPIDAGKKKSITKVVAPVNKERAKSRSGL